MSEQRTWKIPEFIGCENPRSVRCAGKKSKNLVK